MPTEDRINLRHDSLKGYRFADGHCFNNKKGRQR